MKWFIFYAVIVMFSCNTASTMQPDSLMDGTYAAFSENQYGQLNDTLKLAKTVNANGIYTITRHSGTTRIINGKEYPKKLSVETWILQYDPERLMLLELKGGKILLWNFGDETIQWGSIKYKKLDLHAGITENVNK
jgi:hypothetical protein